MLPVAVFRTDTAALNITLFLLLGLATGAKAWLSGRFVVSENTATTGQADDPWLVTMILAAALCTLAFCLPAQHTYLGEIPPNVWHNPSTILLMPFALGLFWSSLRYLRDGRTNWLWISLVLGALNLAAKPSFVLCFLPVFPLAALIRFGIRRREFWRAILLCAAITGLLAGQYIYVYVVDPPGSAVGKSSGIEIAPFLVWKDFTTEIPRAIVASYLFPAVALVLGGRIVWQNRAVRYALALAAVGLLEYALLAERGVRASEGNLTWQAIITQYILFLTLITALVPLLRKERWGVRQVVIPLVFFAYLWAGVHFLTHWFASGNFI